MEYTEFGAVRSSCDSTMVESRHCEVIVAPRRKSTPTAHKEAAVLSSSVQRCTRARCIGGDRNNPAGCSTASGSAHTDFHRECTLMHFQGSQWAET